MRHEQLSEGMHTCERLTPEQQVELVARMRAGCAASRERLIASQMAWVISCSHRWGRGLHAQFDVIAEAMAAWCQYADRFDPAKSTISSYAGMVVRSRFNSLRHYRLKAKRDPLRQVNFVDGQEANVAAEEGLTAAECAERAEAAERVRRAVAKLPERLQRVVALRMQDQTLEQVSAQMGVTKERVRQIEAQAHEQLRQLLTPSLT